MASPRLQILSNMLIVMSLTTLPHIVQSQSAQDPANANADNTVYYFDSNSDCNGPIRELYGFEATIRGNDLSSTRLGPKSCSIRLKSTGQFKGNVLDIEVKAMNIQDDTTKVSIHDGDGSGLILMSYSRYSNQDFNKRRFFTTGDTATFIMTRENINSFNFDIEIKIRPVRGSTDPAYENNYGAGYFFDKFPQTTIVGIIGGFYSLILAICMVIFMYFCCQYQRLNKKWEIQQLATIRTGPAFDTKSQPSNVWSVEMKQTKGPGSQYSVDPRSRRTVARSEDGYSNTSYKVDASQNKRLMNADTDRSRPRYTSSNASFSEPEDDSDHFVEKVITPRVKSSKDWNKLPPPYEDAASDYHSSDEQSEISNSDTSVRKRPLSSETERSELSHSSYTHSESGSDEVSETEDSRSSRGQGARGQKRERKPHKSRRKDSNENVSGPSRTHLPHQKPPPQPLHQIHYGAYPPGQFVPVMMGPNQFQPAAMVQGFPPPSYSEQQSAAPQPRSQVNPTDPPVYSYLVRRGYTPLDTRSTSTAVSQRSGAGRLEEPELRLDSGVEYMRR